MPTRSPDREPYPTPEPRFFAREALQVLRFVDSPGLAESVGLSPADLAGPDATIPISQYYDLWEAAAAATREPHIGLRFVTERASSPAADLGALQILLYSSATIGIGIERLAHYQPLWNQGETYEVKRSGPHCLIRFTPFGPARDAHRHVVEKTFASLVLGSHLVAEGGLEPLQVSIACALPETADDSVASRLLGVPTTYDTEHNQVEVPARVLDRPMRRANEFVFQLFDHQLGTRLGASAPLRDRVAREIAAHLHEGAPSAATVAARLGCSSRTLQRRLLEERTTLRDLIEQVRMTRAKSLLDTQISLTETAFLLGYSEMTNFSRAFSRWTGQRPSEWRARRR